MQRAILAACGVLSLLVAGSAVVAAPFDGKGVSPQAKWVMHVDFDAFHKTLLADKIRAKMEEPKGQEKLKWVAERYGMDPRKDLHGVTLFGETFAPHQGTVIFQADFDKEKVLKLLEKEPDYRAIKLGDDTVYTWTARHHGHKHTAKEGEAKRESDKPKMKLTAAFRKGLVVMSSDGLDVVRTLGQLDGKSEGLGKDSMLSQGKPKPGMVLYGAAIDLAGLAGRHDRFGKIAILKQGENVKVSLGENEGDAFYHVVFNAQAEETAKQLQAVVAGFHAMLQLQAAVKEDLAPIVKGLKWEVDGKEVVVEWKAKAADVLALAKKRIDAHRAKHHGGK